MVYNVTQRWESAVWIGFVLEALLLLVLFVRIEFLRDLLGYLSLGWFIYLLFVRYDHFGKVCAGEYLTIRNEQTQFPNHQKAGDIITYYVAAIWTLVLVLFMSVLLYSCFADTVRRPNKEKENEHD